jgi:hypothetical protein
MYVSANHPFGALRADASSVGAYEEFALAFHPDGSVTLRGPSGGPVAPTTSGATLVDSWAPTATLGGDFDIVPLSGSYALRSTANGQFVTAPSSDSPLVATGGSGTAPGWYDTFYFTHQPEGWGHVALRWEAHNQYVCAESAGSGPLIANRAAAQWWEMFLLMWNTDGTFSLQAAVNGRHVSAPSDGGPLIANQTQIGPSEKFDLVGTLGVAW